MAWTIWLKASCPPTFDHRYLDGRIPHIVWQPEGMAAGQGEIQAEVCSKVQMA